MMLSICNLCETVCDHIVQKHFNSPVRLEQYYINLSFQVFTSFTTIPVTAHKNKASVISVLKSPFILMISMYVRIQLVMEASLFILECAHCCLTKETGWTYGHNKAERWHLVRTVHAVHKQKACRLFLATRTQIGTFLSRVYVNNKTQRVHSSFIGVNDYSSLTDSHTGL